MLWATAFNKGMTQMHDCNQVFPQECGNSMLKPLLPSSLVLLMTHRYLGAAGQETRGQWRHILPPSSKCHATFDWTLADMTWCSRKRYCLDSNYQDHVFIFNASSWGVVHSRYWLGMTWHLQQNAVHSFFLLQCVGTIFECIASENWATKFSIDEQIQKKNSSKEVTFVF
jgi:hypothetical protein